MTLPLWEGGRTPAGILGKDPMWQCGMRKGGSTLFRAKCRGAACMAGKGWAKGVESRICGGGAGSPGGGGLTWL